MLHFWKLVINVASWEAAQSFASPFGDR
jgi:hypothetical protein